MCILQVTSTCKWLAVSVYERNYLYAFEERFVCYGTLTLRSLGKKGLTFLNCMQYSLYLHQSIQRENALHSPKKQSNKKHYTLYKTAY